MSYPLQFSICCSLNSARFPVLIATIDSMVSMTLKAKQLPQVLDCFFTLEMTWDSLLKLISHETNRQVDRLRSTYQSTLVGSFNDFDLKTVPLENLNFLQTLLILLRFCLAVKLFVCSELAYLERKLFSLALIKSASATRDLFDVLLRFKVSRISKESISSLLVNSLSLLLLILAWWMSFALELKIIIGIANMQKQKHAVKIIISSRNVNSIFSHPTTQQD